MRMLPNCRLYRDTLKEKPITAQGKLLMTLKNVMIAGYGYLGHNIGNDLLNQGYFVTAIRRNINSIVPAANLAYLSVDLDLPEISISLPEGEYALIYLIPPAKSSCDDNRLVRFLSALRQPPSRIIYISTTGVYGDCQGEWVDENRPVNPSNERSRRRYSAEQNIISYCQTRKLEYIILRVPGIYGPKRLPLQRIIDQTPVLCPDTSLFSNRIHVVDLTQICLAALLTSASNKVLNVSDGFPSSMTDFIYTVADLAGLDRPPCISEIDDKNAFSESMLSYLSESRKIDNATMLKTLNVSLHYADYTVGIKHSLL